MFGYVMINKQELKIKDYDRYQSYYCGLCQMLKKQHGIKGQITLTYDMTFLVLFLTALYEPKTRTAEIRCALHPLQSRSIRVNRYSKYAADMNIALTYYKMQDDWKDEKKIRGLAGIVLYRKQLKDLENRYPRQCGKIKQSLDMLLSYEKKPFKEPMKALDAVSGCFGAITEELFVYKQDEWEHSLRKIGFFLGKFIYLLDAYEDLGKDKKERTYNPFFPICREPDYNEKVKRILTLMMAECAKEFEKLPILTETGILRNILYSGVWMRYEQIKKKEGKKHDF